MRQENLATDETQIFEYGKRKEGKINRAHKDLISFLLPYSPNVSIDPTSVIF